MPRLVEHPLWVTWDHDDKTWVVGFPWFCTVGGYGVSIPPGFKSDLASIPRALWWVPGFSPYELGLDGPVVHDWLYQKGAYTFEIAETITVKTITRREVDHIFKTLMQESNVGPFRRNAAWAAVRCFGWLCWGRREAQRDERYSGSDAGGEAPK